MSYGRRAPRVDRNHGEIVDALRQAGASVQSLVKVGDGCPDLLVARAGQMWLIEVKDGEARASQRVLTDPEREWHQRWPAPVYVAQSPSEALAIVGIRDPLAELGRIAGESIAKSPK